MLAFSPAVVVVAVMAVPSSVMVVDEAAAFPAVSIATNATASAMRGVRRRTCRESNMGDPLLRRTGMKPGAPDPMHLFAWSESQRKGATPVKVIRTSCFRLRHLAQARRSGGCEALWYPAS